MTGGGKVSAPCTFGTSLMKFSLGSVPQIKLTLLALGRTIIKFY